MGRHARPTRGGKLLSMRSRQQSGYSFSWRAPSPTLEGRKKKAKTQKEGKKSKGDQTLGYLGVVNPVTSEEDVPLRGKVNLEMACR
ncbi:hypothetical protein AVEN_186227-1 [Araneus ventricosus]|uniref:Uncharacterized protein n=1 Tax=Araneus ventricosus TaxID=182803 RepID=A0A4Y2T567_ARAVE|nr:hypothetical protein AVEN_91903-1 [Araneus ventricosus]GBN94539.1 hypothetical protein AVEN_186227-1 [Araneus ventricosus]